MRIARASLSSPVHRDDGLGVGEEVVHSVGSLHRSHGEVSTHAHQADIGLVEVVDQLHVSVESGISGEVDHVVVGGIQDEAVSLSTDVAAVLSAHTRGVLLLIKMHANIQRIVIIMLL